jgi:hypothetical protein
MDIRKNLERMKVNTTGTAGAMIGTLLAMPPAALLGLVDIVQGGSLDRAGAVVDWGHEHGESFAKKNADEIVKLTWEALRMSAEHYNKARGTNE